MEESDKRQLEGLLQARSADIRHGLRPRRRRIAQAPTLESAAADQDPRDEVLASRGCEACGAEIGGHRLRALPRATLCLDCRRSAERASAPS